MAKWNTRQPVNVVLKRLPKALKQAAKEALDEETPQLVAAMKRACPVSEDLEKTPGELRDSIHAYDGQRALKGGGVRVELIKTVIADAKDEHGDFIGHHVEDGHMAKDGTRVPAHPFFFPTWRANRDGIRRRMAAKGRAAARAIAGDMAK